MRLEKLRRGMKGPLQRGLGARDRRRLRRAPFCVISDDCWGSRIYQHLGRPYNTPFVGLLLQTPYYVRLLSSLESYLAMPLDFGDDVWSPSTGRHVPLGLLGDVEIRFLHYPDRGHAADAWNRRVERVDYDNLFVKIDVGKNEARPEDLAAFTDLPFEQKVAFSRSPQPGAVHIPDWHGNGYLLFNETQRVFDAVSWVLRDDPSPRRWATLAW